MYRQLIDMAAALLENEVFAAGFQMGQIQSRPMLQFFQVVRQQLRAVVMRLGTQFTIFVRKSAFHDQQVQIIVAVQRLPECVIAGGIAAEGKTADTVLHPVTGRRHHVIHGDHFHAAVVDPDLLPRLT